MAAARSADAAVRREIVSVCRRLYERGLIAGMEPLLRGHDVFLPANHGATTLGPSLTVAYGRMESLEHSARILLAARLIGRVRTLTADQVRDLVAARDEAGRPAP